MATHPYGPECACVISTGMAGGLERRIRALDAENRELRMQVEQLRGALRRGADDLDRLAAEFMADAEVRVLALHRAADENQQRMI
jgi:hypothetical protein